MTKSASAEHLSADLDLWSWDFTDEERGGGLKLPASPKSLPGPGEAGTGCNELSQGLLLLRVHV